MAFRLAALVHRVAPALTRAVVSEAAPSLKARLRTDVLASLKVRRNQHRWIHSCNVQLTVGQGGASERWRATVAKSVIAEITTAEKSATSSKAINENAIAMRCINRRASLSEFEKKNFTYLHLARS
jgi:DNA polymerase III psi subunit